MTDQALSQRVPVTCAGCDKAYTVEPNIRFLRCLCGAETPVRTLCQRLRQSESVWRERAAATRVQPRPEPWVLSESWEDACEREAQQYDAEARLLGEAADALDALQRERDKLREELRVTDDLLNERQRVLDAIPACPAHGACVPHALEWVARRVGAELLAREEGAE
jgi:hypothetical protein